MTIHAWTYIPTGIILGALSSLFGGGDKPKGYLAGSLTPEVAVNGVDTFIFQFNPEQWGFNRRVEWKDKVTVHTSRSQYKHTGLAQFQMSLHVFDDMDGTPEGFDNLLEVYAWFNALADPVASLGRPPYLDLVIGGLSSRVKVNSVEIRNMKSYKEDDMPRWGIIGLMLSEAGGDEFLKLGEDFTGKFKKIQALDSAGLFGDLF